MEAFENSKMDIQQQDISFPCEGKCRICPFPGANCAGGHDINNKNRMNNGGEDNAKRDQKQL